MYIAVVADGRVATVESNEAASLESMNVLARQATRVVRILTNARVFADYSNGRALRTELEVEDGRPVVRIVRA